MTDQDLYTTVQYHLIEPTDGGLTYSSGLYTATEVTARLNYRLKDFYKKTNIIADRDISLSTTANVRDQDYPSDMIDIIRLGIQCDC